MHWTQTPEGRQKLAERMAAFHKTPAGKRAAKRRGKKWRKIAAAKRAAGLNGHSPIASAARAMRAKSGRAMLVELARPEAARKIVALQKEIETLTLFLEKTKP